MFSMTYACGGLSGVRTTLRPIFKFRTFFVWTFRVARTKNNISGICKVTWRASSAAEPPSRSFKPSSGRSEPTTRSRTSTATSSRSSDGGVTATKTAICRRWTLNATMNRPVLSTMTTRFWCNFVFVCLWCYSVSDSLKTSVTSQHGTI